MTIMITATGTTRQRSSCERQPEPQRPQTRRRLDPPVRLRLFQPLDRFQSSQRQPTRLCRPLRRPRLQRKLPRIPPRQCPRKGHNPRIPLPQHRRKGLNPQIRPAQPPLRLPPPLQSRHRLESRQRPRLQLPRRARPPEVRGPRLNHPPPHRHPRAPLSPARPCQAQRQPLWLDQPHLWRPSNPSSRLF